MKKQFLMGISLAFCSLSFCQIQLVYTDFATANDTVRLSIVNPTTVDFDTTGPNMTWDFSNLVPNTQKLVQFPDLSGTDISTKAEFGPFAFAQYRATYYQPATDLPISQIGSLIPTVQIQDVYRYTKVKDTAIMTVGLSIQTSLTNIPKHSDIIETCYKLPMDYGNQYTSFGYTAMDFNPILDAKFNQHRKRVSQVDGFGTVVTPYDTFQVIRVHHVITETDSIYINISGFSQWIPIPVPLAHQYEWWAKNEKLPVLAINTSEVAGQETVTSITYRDVFHYDLVASIKENELVKTSLYPNPVSDKLTIQSEKQIASLNVFSSDGKIALQKSTVTSSTTSVDVSKLDRGVYIVHILYHDGTESESTFIKE